VPSPRSVLPFARLFGQRRPSEDQHNGDKPAGDTDAAEPAGPTTVLWRVLPGLTLAAATVAVLLWCLTPATDIARYAAYLAGAVLLPGVLLHRALRQADSLLEELTVGFSVGLAGELAAWAVGTALGVQDWLWTWPLAVVAVTAAVPRLRRRCWRLRRYPSVMPVGWSWVLVACGLYLLGYLLVSYLGVNRLAPAVDQPYPDLLYHLALAAEAGREIPPGDPQAAGLSLPYHWFANAHLATASGISGVDLQTVLLRLWLPPAVFAVLGLITVLGWRLTRRPWVGVLAAVLAFSVGELDPWPWVSSPLGSLTLFSVWASPSQTYAWLFVLPAALLLAELLADRTPGEADRNGRGGWVVLAMMLLAASGSKSTCLPVLLAGVVVVMAHRLWTARDVPLARRVPLRHWAAFALVAVILVVAQVTLFGEASHGVMLRPGQIVLRSVTIFLLAGTFGRDVTLANLTFDLFMVGAVVLWLVSLLLRLAGVGVLLRLGRRMSTEQVLLVGIAAGGVLATLLVDHPASSQLYFLRTAYPIAVVASAWGLALLLPTERVRRAAVARLAGVAAASVAVVVATSVAIRRALLPVPHLLPTGTPTRTSLAVALLVPLLVLAGVGVVAVLGWLVARRRWRGLVGWGAATAVVAVFALGLPAWPIDFSKNIRSLATDGLPVRTPLTAEPPTADLQRAGRWIAAHAATDDIVATNHHCKMARTDECDARSFAAAAATQRRMLVGAWGYSPYVLQLEGTGLPYYLRPFPEPKTFEANERAFYHPSAAAMAELRDRYRVRWLLVDRTAGDVGDVGRYAEARYRSGTATVYELSG
jgi:hypothetical protein